MRLVEVGGIELDVHDVGTGDSVVLVQTALTADELAPLAEHLVARGAFRAIVYHRRGYASSSPVEGPGSVVRDAADCRDLIDALGLGRVHIVGYSYSGAVGLQLAADAVERVQTLALIEPPPVHVPSSEEFRAANARLQEVMSSRGRRRPPSTGHLCSRASGWLGRTWSLPKPFCSAPPGELTAQRTRGLAHRTGTDSCVDGVGRVTYNVWLAALSVPRPSSVPA